MGIYIRLNRGCCHGFIRYFKGVVIVFSRACKKLCVVIIVCVSINLSCGGYFWHKVKFLMGNYSGAIIIILVALVLDMSRTCPGLVPTVPFFGKNTVFMGTQDRLQNVSHRSVTCPSCPATRLCQSRTKNKRASHGPKITVADQK